MNVYIGWWARRIGKWHRVESEITDRLVMNCGRQMKLETAKGRLQFQLERVADICRQCAP